MSSSVQLLSPVRTVFLDRDGVLNRKMPEGEYVTGWEQFEILPGVVDAIGRLNRAGVRAIVISNQRGVALGKMTEADVNNVHARLADLLAAEGAHLDAFFYCPHDKNACTCRKPLPGLFEHPVMEGAHRRIGKCFTLVDKAIGHRRMQWRHPDRKKPPVGQLTAHK